MQALENLYKQQAAVRTSGGGSSGGGRSGGSSKSGGQEQGDVYQQLYNSGARSERDAYAALLAMGYNTTQAGKLAGFFGEMLEEGSFGGNGGGSDGGVSVDMKSVLGLGYGPIDEAALSGLVSSGQVEEYQEGNKIKFRKKTGGGIAGGKAW